MKIALTSCRENSKRLYRKELRLLGPKTIMEYTLDQMVELKEFFELMLVSTDWIELIEKFEASYPEIVFIRRPKELALDHIHAQEYITPALEPYHQEGNEYCLLQSNSPLRRTELVIDTYASFNGFGMIYNSLFTVNHHTLYPDGQVYWFRDYEDIWKRPSYIYYQNPSVDIDYPHDLCIAEFELKERLKRNE